MKDEIIKAAKNTVGYSEASNKESFMAGVGVGFNKAEELYIRRIELLEQRALYAEGAHNEILDDLKTFSGIINKYSE